MDKQNRIIGCIGAKGSGKSTAFQKILTFEKRQVLFDAMDEHEWCPNRFTDLADLLDFLDSQFDFEAGEVQAYFAARYVPSGDPENEVEDFCAEMFRYQMVTLGFEEVPQFAAASYLPRNFGRVIRQGRHRKISTIWTGQRASEVPRSLTAQTDIFGIFRQREPADLDALSARCGDDVARRVAKLGLHDCITFNALTGETRERLWLPWVEKDKAGALALSRLQSA